MAKDDLTQTDLLLQIAQTLATVQAQATGGTDMAEALAKITDTLAGIANRTRPENPEHNRISAYNPLGVRDGERPQLKCDIWWVGYPETPETLTDAEIACLNRLEPGIYQVTKGNGNMIPFTVTPKLRMDGTYERLEVYFPCKGDQSTDHRSKIDYCREAMGEKVPRLEDLEAELRALRAKVGAAA